MTEEATRQEQREAFDKWWDTQPLRSDRYRAAYYDVSWRAWQAAVDRHPPAQPEQCPNCPSVMRSVRGPIFSEHGGAYLGECRAAWHDSASREPQAAPAQGGEHERS